MHAGATDESGKTLVRLLKDNHQRWHIYFNEEGFHNHATHHLYAIYALGADTSLLEAAYATHTVYLKPSFDSPGDITKSNWKDHMSDDKFYQAYVKFFSANILEKGISANLEEYVFSPGANFENGREYKDQPQMLNRFISGALHPLIHAGHALEFGTPGMLAEGLAMACTQQTDSDDLIPASLFSTHSNIPTSTVKKSKGVHSFTLLSRMFNDPQLAPSVACRPVHYSEQPESADQPHFEVLKSAAAELVLKYVDEWKVYAEDKDDVKAKIEELSFLVTLIYGVAGVRSGKEFNADFVFMHLVTSSLFIHSYVDYLSSYALNILLRSYLSTVLGFWITRGRPEINLKHIYDTVTAHPTLPGPIPKPAQETINPPNLKLTPNPWLSILQTTLVHPNKHLPKIQRALAHYASVYGMIEAGRFSTTELEGADRLDGTVFIRLAGETARRIGWVREGEIRGDWDFSGFWRA